MGAEPPITPDVLGVSADPAPTASRWRSVAVTVAVLRYLIPLAAIPSVPFLLPDRVVLLVLVRPTKEFLLIGGAQHRVRGEPELWLLLAAFVPLMVLAVWAFFAVGRSYREPLARGEAPRWLQRVVPPRRLAIAQGVLDRHGPAIAILGRIGALPPTVLAAAAGASDVSARRYLAADTVGALISFSLMVGAGHALGRAWQEGGSWLTVVGFGLFVAVLVVLARWFRAEGRAVDARTAAAAASQSSSRG